MIQEIELRCQALGQRFDLVWRRDLVEPLEHLMRELVSLAETPTNAGRSVDRIIAQRPASQNLS